MRTATLPAFGGEKARRLYWAAKNGGIVKIADDGFLWIFERTPRTLVSEGTILPAAKFAAMAAKTLGIPVEELFEADDQAIRQVAQKIAEINFLNARNVARGLENAQQ